MLKKSSAQGNTMEEWIMVYCFMLGRDSYESLTWEWKENF